MEPEELWEDADSDNQSNDSGHASAPDHHEVESSSLFDNPDLEIDHDHTDSSLETLQELGIILKTKHKNSLTEKTMHNIAFFTSELMPATVLRLKNGLKRCLDSADVDINEIEGLEELFAESDDLCKAAKIFCCTSGDENWKQSAGYVVRGQLILH